MGEMHLPREGYMVLAAVAWSDDKMERNEADAILRAAVDEGLPLEEIQGLEVKLQSPVKLADVDLSAIAGEHRLYLYAIATWVATVSNGVNQRERAVLDELKDKLRLTPRECDVLDQAVCDVLLKPHGMRPSRFDLPGLFQAVAERVQKLGQEAAPG